MCIIDSENTKEQPCAPSLMVLHENSFGAAFVIMILNVVRCLCWFCFGNIQNKNGVCRISHTGSRTMKRNNKISEVPSLDPSLGRLEHGNCWSRKMAEVLTSKTPDFLDHMTWISQASPSTLRTTCGHQSRYNTPGKPLFQWNYRLMFGTCLETDVNNTWVRFTGGNVAKMRHEIPGQLPWFVCWYNTYCNKKRSDSKPDACHFQLPFLSSI